MIEYKGYHGAFSFDDEAGIFHGEVMGTHDVITFQGKSVAELRTAFRDSIDAYLKFCAKRGRRPNPPGSATAQEHDSVIETLDSS